MMDDAFLCAFIFSICVVCLVSNLAAWSTFALMRNSVLLTYCSLIYFSVAYSATCRKKSHLLFIKFIMAALDAAVYIHCYKLWTGNGFSSLLSLKTIRHFIFWCCIQTGDKIFCGVYFWNICHENELKFLNSNTSLYFKSNCKYLHICLCREICPVSLKWKNFSRCLFIFSFICLISGFHEILDVFIV